MNLLLCWHTLQATYRIYHRKVPKSITLRKLYVVASSSASLGCQQVKHLGERSLIN